MTEGKLKQELKKYYDNYKLDPDITEDFKAGIFDGTKAASRFLDEAKKELFVFLKTYVKSESTLDENWLLLQYDKWTTKWFGETPYEQWLDDLL
jgi:hypothetical protein